MALKDREEVIASLLEVTENGATKAKMRVLYRRPYLIKKNSSRVGG
jgi:hypothetical protein